MTTITSRKADMTMLLCISVVGENIYSYMLHVTGVNNKMPWEGQTKTPCSHESSTPPTYFFIHAVVRELPKLISPEPSIGEGSASLCCTAGEFSIHEYPEATTSKSAVSACAAGQQHGGRPP
jgi:hypothetical protein